MEHKASARPDAVIRALAVKQNGVVYRAQLLAAGLTHAQIRRRMADGRLVQLHRGVYLVGAVPAEWAYPQAALFACGPDSALFAFSALGIWNLRSYPPKAHPWVLVPPDRRVERPRIVVHRGALAPQDVRHRHGLRVTSPPRTIIDVASYVDDRYELESIVAEAHFRGLARERELRERLERNAGRRGVARLGAILDMEGGPQRTRSQGERAMLRLLRSRGIAGFQANATVCGYEVDFLWRDLNFCVELDGWDAHSGRAAFERDRLKWARLEAGGVSVMSVSGRQLACDADGVVERLLATLRRHGYSG